MNISIVGDIMLGRFVSEKYKQTPYAVMDNDIIKKLSSSDYVVANLESPIASDNSNDSLRFCASEDLLQEVKVVDLFSLSNNHINDFGYYGMQNTIDALERNGFEYNGLFLDKYKPHCFHFSNEKLAIFTCSDMMNVEFDENNPYRTLRLDNKSILNETIREYKKSGYFCVLYAHVGMLFSRFPNPIIREFCHSITETDIDVIVTAHPHCVGGMEIINNTHIFYSLGDFLMDGGSFRRRESIILSLDVQAGKLVSWEVTPVITTGDLQVILPTEAIEKRIRKSFDFVSKQLKKKTKYNRFYRYQYKVELFYHSKSTLSFLYKQKGIKGFLRILYIRSRDVLNMIRRMFQDRSNMSYDSDAVGEKYRLSNDDIK